MRTPGNSSKLRFANKFTWSCPFPQNIKSLVGAISSVLLVVAARIVLCCTDPHFDDGFEKIQSNFSLPDGQVLGSGLVLRSFQDPLFHISYKWLEKTEDFKTEVTGSQVFIPSKRITCFSLALRNANALSGWEVQVWNAVSFCGCCYFCLLVCFYSKGLECRFWGQTAQVLPTALPCSGQPSLGKVDFLWSSLILTEPTHT